MARWTLSLTLGFLISLPAFAARNGASKANTGTATEAAKKGVDVLNQKEAAACASMDQTASAALWAEDGVDLIQGMQPMIGKEVISKWYDSLTPQLRGAKMEYCTIDWREIRIHGDWAYEWGITRQKIDFPPPQKAFESQGKMLYILKRQKNGEWKIEVESWSSIPPPQQTK